ncbi:MAG: TetR/AcrR family transcriptional regulator [Candidatus Heimdallarchaeota archaeon]
MSYSKKPRNKEKTVNKIYDKFFKLVLEEGYHKASTNKIAKKANISIGTLYHHFPEGKKDIIRKYFENSVETSVELSAFEKFDMSNIASVFRGFVSNVLKNHRKNKAYQMAFRSALLSDKTLSQAHRERVIAISTDLVDKLQETSDFFKSIEKPRLIRSIVFVYNIVNAIIYHHLVFMDLFEKDDDLVDYVSNLLGFTITYFQKK